MWQTRIFISGVLLISVSTLFADETHDDPVQEPSDSQLNKVCGVLNESLTTNARAAQGLNQFPWMVRLSKSAGWTCTGSLISSRYVLTSARCLSTPFLLGVHVGVRNVPGYPIIALVDELIPHPEYNVNFNTNNIGLIRLKEEVEFSEYVLPICLFSSNNHEGYATTGDIVYSSNDGIPGMPKRLQKTRIVSHDIITNEECRQLCENSAGTFEITDKDMCTRMTVGQCSGSEGGPLVYNHENQWHQEGIILFHLSDICQEYSNDHSLVVSHAVNVFGTSTSQVCGDGRVVVHTKVSSYRDWIEEHINA